VDERDYSPAAAQSGLVRRRSAALTAPVAVPFLLLGALVLRWLDPTLAAHFVHAERTTALIFRTRVQRAAALSLLGRYGALLAIAVLNVLLAYMARVELSAPRTRFEHVVNVLALPLFGIFFTILLLGFADPDIPNIRFLELLVIAICFASLSLASYIYGLWWAMGHAYRWPALLPPAGEAWEPITSRAKRPVGGIWLEPLVASRPLAPIWQVALLGPTLAITVVQVAIIWSVSASHMSDSWLGQSLLASFVGGVIMLALLLLAMWRASPVLPRYRRFSRTPAPVGELWQVTVEFRRDVPPPS
jgi:hypothetical protein